MSEENNNVLKVTLDYLPTLSLAQYINKVKLVSQMQVTNCSESDLSDLHISVVGNHVGEYQTHVDLLPAGLTLTLNDIELNPDVEYLFRLTEATPSALTIEADKGGESVYKQTFTLDLLPYDQWAGANILPEILSAYVMPNSPTLAAISRSAASYLEEWTGDASLDGYQSLDRNRVRMQVAALYEVLKNQHIVYANPPASFESNGQRIRMADKVVAEKLGTCLDLTLLMASLIESIGLYPIIVLLRGHALVGAWLTSEVYTHKVGDDESFLLKESADGNNNIVLVETTALVHGKQISFDSAADLAIMKVREPNSLLYFIDVHRCRLDHIMPLPQVADINASTLNEPTVTSVAAAGQEPVSQLSHYSLHLEQLSRPITRQEIWERKLLDFSLRNNLINTKVGRRVIPFVSFAVENIENQLQAGQDFRVVPWTGKRVEPGEWGIYDSHLQALQSKDFVTEIIRQNQLVSYLSDRELQESLTYLYRSSRTAIEENGANSLFLVLGMMKWFENPKSTVPRFAPILLLPIEIIRKGGIYSYVLRMRDDGILLNITLVELLKQQFKINLDFLNTLPADESGVDVKLVFTGIRRAIAHMQGWDVMEESLLGMFSFNKFVMWNDIHNNADKLRENHIVSSLIENKLKWDADDEQTDPRQIDRTGSPADYAIPLDADSSQMEAIVESGKGKSFILHGPPGTGKSQTITNMIANALYQGKRVLFVAEKMAALSVVQSRLEKIGLSPFCLELHSNKVTKVHFLSQMKKALDVVHINNPETFVQASEELYNQRIKLIANMEAMHKKQLCGLSLHDIINRYLSIEESELPADWAKVSSLQSEDFDWWEREASRIMAICQLVGPPNSHPLSGLEPKDNDSVTIDHLRSHLTDYQQHFPAFAQARDDAFAKWKLPCRSRSGFQWLAETAKLLRSFPVLNTSMVELMLNDNNLSLLRDYQSKGVSRDNIKNSLLQRFSELLFQEDGLQLQSQWREIGQKWFVPRFFSRRSFLKNLCKYGQLQPDEVDGVLSQLIEYQQLKRDVASVSQLAQGYFDTIAMPEAEKWADIAAVLEGLPKLKTHLNDYSKASGKPLPDVIEAFQGMLQTPWNVNREYLLAPVEQLLEQFDLLHNIFINISRYSELAIPTADLYPELNSRTTLWLDNYSLVNEWYQWIAKKRELKPTCLSHIIEKIEQGDASEAAYRSFLKGVYHKLATEIIDGNSDLRMFNGMLFDRVIGEYRQLTANFQELTKKELYCRMAARVPTTLDAAIATSELGILKRNIMNNGRGNSIRSIIDSIPTLLPKLCPCMLMSPISVAQYVDIEREKFDIVIFDEASQMPTSEAVGAIARGKSLIVVGDPKQMPPTSFFSTSQVDDDEVDIDDMESILDDCIALSVPSHYLTWHYRSRHESLIAFSNSNYYDNGLLTFPSVDDGISKVHLVPVKGVYDKGHSRSNAAEAQAIVNEVIRRLKDPTLSKYSIGIVSFSKVQQNRIEDMLSEQLSAYPELEEKAYNSAEPIFIKNLENVQGDERDVIMFSVGYGPDKQGRVSMNFGPLNNVGGERRLNVAVSRSRYEMYVFSSLRSGQIDLRRSNALGVIGLKSFLEYAEHGGRIIGSSSTEEAVEQIVISQLAELLHRDGYTTNTQVGRSKFKVDLAIANRNNPEQYVLGILIDGRSYYSTKTTRDREIVQPSILASLGWTVMRLWTLDWYQNPERAYQRVLEELHKAEQTAGSPHIGNIAAVPEFKFDADDLADELVLNTAEQPTVSNDYDKLDLPEMRILQDNRVLLERVFSAIVDHEQPITRAYLLRRAASVSAERPASISKYADNVLATLHKEQPVDQLPEYYFADAAVAKDYDTFRMAGERDINEVPAIELMNALRWVLAQNGASPRADLFRATAQMLGFPRRTPRITAALDASLGSLLLEKSVQANGDIIILIDQ